MVEYSDGSKYDRQVDNPFAQLWYGMVEHYLRVYLPERGRVLDAGGGTGEFSIRAARINSGLRIVNCDLSKGMLGRAEEKIKELGLGERIKNILGDITDLPFKEGEFDYVMCLGDTLSLCRDVEKAFSELVRVTSKRLHLSVNAFWGNFFSMMAYGPEKKFHFQDLMNYYQSRIIHQDGKSMHCRSFTIEELEGMGEEHALHIVKEFSTPIFTVWNEWLSDPEKLSKIKELQYKHCEDRRLINLGNHLNIIFET